MKVDQAVRPLPPKSLNILVGLSLCDINIVLPLKLDWVLTTIEAFWEKYWALIDFQCVLESYVKVHNCSSLAIY